MKTNEIKKVIEITFRDVIEVTDEEVAYKWLLSYMEQCVNNKDLEAFTFNERV